MFKKEKSLQTGPGHNAPIRGGGGGNEGKLHPKLLKKTQYDHNWFFFFLLNKKIISRFHILFPTLKKAPKLNIETIEVQPNWNPKK